MMRFVLLAVASLLLLATSAVAQDTDLDCADFDSQAEARPRQTSPATRAIPGPEIVFGNSCIR